MLLLIPLLLIPLLLCVGGRDPNIIRRPPISDLRVGESPPGPRVLKRPELPPPKLPPDALPTLLLPPLPNEKCDDPGEKDWRPESSVSTTTDDAYGRRGPGSQTLTTPAPVSCGKVVVVVVG